LECVKAYVCFTRYPSVERDGALQEVPISEAIPLRTLAKMPPAQTTLVGGGMAGLGRWTFSRDPVLFFQFTPVPATFGPVAIHEKRSSRSGDTIHEMPVPIVVPVYNSERSLPLLSKG
jgi:hypothetical protein